MKRRTKAEWMADHAAIFDASRLRHDRQRREAFLKRAERVFDQELENAWGGQFTLSGRSSTDDGSAWRESESALDSQFEANPVGREAPSRFSKLARQLGVWLGIALMMVMVYGFRHEISKVGDRLVAFLIPSLGYRLDAQTVSFSSDANGQFWIDARANDIWFRFLVDTGASSIVLSKADARQLGFYAADLRFNLTIWTANGLTRAAAVRLQKLQIGPIVVTDVPALIDDGDLRHPLLGMEFLKRLSTVEFKNGTLTIHGS